MGRKDGPEDWALDPEGFDEVMRSLEAEADQVYETVREFPKQFDLFVPRCIDDSEFTGIPAGSGIIGVPDAENPDDVRLFVGEPDEFGEERGTLTDRALSALGWFYEAEAEGRLPWGTVARNSLLAIGAFIPGFESRIELHPEAEAEAARWLGLDGKPVPPTELIEDPELKAEMIELLFPPDELN